MWSIVQIRELSAPVMNREPININEIPVSCLGSNSDNTDLAVFSADADRKIFTKTSVIDCRGAIVAVFISSGRGQIVHCGYEQQLKPGTVFILDGKNRLEILPVSPVVIYTCAFVPELFGRKVQRSPVLADISSEPVLEPFFSRCGADCRAWRIPTAKSEAFQNLFCSMTDSAKLSGIIRDGIMRLRISELLLNLADITGTENDAPAPTGSETVTQAIAYLRRNYTGKINCDDLARAVCVSRSKLFADFRAVTGKTIGKYIEELRISKAASLLLSTNDTVYNIMYEVGYHDMKMFCRRFREQMKTTPSEYRKSNR